MTRRLIWIGPWADDEHPDRPRPEDHVDLSWDQFDRGQVAVYLKRGFTVGAPLDGDTTCSMCGKKMYRGFIQTDGTYTWRSGLSHYVDEHSVRLPQVFIDHVVQVCDQVDEVEADDWRWWDGDPYADEASPAESV